MYLLLGHTGRKPIVGEAHTQILEDWFHTRPVRYGKEMQRRQENFWEEKEKKYRKKVF